MMKITVLLFGIIIAACLASEESQIAALNAKMKAAKEAMAHMKFDVKSIEEKIKNQIWETVSEQPDDIKKIMNVGESQTGFFEVMPNLSSSEVADRVQRVVDKKMEPFFSGFRNDILAENPLLTEGMKVSVTTRRGIIKGRITQISDKSVQIGSQVVFKEDMSKEIALRLDEKEYDKYIRAQWEKYKRTQLNYNEEFNKMYNKTMLKSGYLPLISGNELEFNFSNDVFWITRKKLLENLSRREVQRQYNEGIEAFCKKTYKMGFMEMASKINQLKEEIKIRNRKYESSRQNSDRHRD